MKENESICDSPLLGGLEGLLDFHAMHVEAEVLELRRVGKVVEGAGAPDDPMPVRAASPLRTRKALARVLVGVFALYALWLARPWNVLPVLNQVGLAAVPLAAALCVIWRARRLPPRESAPWFWLAAAAVLWSAGPVSSIFSTTGGTALSLNPNLSTVFFAAAGLPLLLAVSSTRDTGSTRLVFFLDLTLAAIILTLLCVRVYGMGVQGAPSHQDLTRIYLGESGLIALASFLRTLTWSTWEERRRIHLLGAVISMLVLAQLGIHYAGRRWHLPQDSVFDIFWSLPFFFGGWQSLHLTISRASSTEQRQLNRAGLLLDSMAPLAITSAAFVMAASIASQHPVLALSALGVILLLQSLHAALAQLNVHDGQVLLLERERQLQQANFNLERLSMEDPLTGAARG